MEAIETHLVGYPQKDQDGARHADRKPGDINKAKAPPPRKAAPRRFEVVFKHNSQKPQDAGQNHNQLIPSNPDTSEAINECPPAIHSLSGPTATSLIQWFHHDVLE